MSDVHTLEARLSALERQNRLFKKVGAAAVLVALAAFVMGQATPKKEPTGKRVVEAEEFRLVDKDGKRRGNWSVLADGSIRLSLNDKNGKLAAIGPYVPMVPQAWAYTTRTGRPADCGACLPTTPQACSYMTKTRRPAARGPYSPTAPQTCPSLTRTARSSTWGLDRPAGSTSGARPVTVARQRLLILAVLLLLPAVALIAWDPPVFPRFPSK